MVWLIHPARGPYDKSFRKVKCASKKQWYWDFLLELVIEQVGRIAHFTLSTEAEIRQLTHIFEDLTNRWVLADKENRSKDTHKELWQEKQIAINNTQTKERTWIEHVIGVLKENRKTELELEPCNRSMKRHSCAFTINRCLLACQTLFSTLLCSFGSGFINVVTQLG